MRQVKTALWAGVALVALVYILSSIVTSLIPLIVVGFIMLMIYKLVLGGRRY